VSKLKVLSIGDAGVRTGFERVAREILSHWVAQGWADVVHYGIMYEGQPDLAYPYPVYPTKKEKDLFQHEALTGWIKKHQPDAVWSLNDLWHQQIYVANKDPVAEPFIGYFPVDTPNMKWHFSLALGGMAGAVAYSEFGARETAAGVRDALDIFAAGLEARLGADYQTKRHRYLSLDVAGGIKYHFRTDRLARYQNPASIAVIPHGLDVTHFQPRDRAAARALFGIPEHAFVVLNVNTNQFRKRLDLTLRAFALLAEYAPEARLVLHCAGHTTQGWDLQQLALYLGIQDRCIFVHEHADQLTEDQLVSLYNTADVMINTAGGEGWGLTAIEGAACGIPQLVPDWSVTREMWTGHGALLPVLDWRIEPGFINTAHAIVDARSAGAILVDLWGNRDTLQTLSRAGLALVERQWTWARVAEAMFGVVEQAVAEPEPEALTFPEILERRDGVVESELKRALWWERGEPVRTTDLRRALEVKADALAGATDDDLGAVGSGVGDAGTGAEGP
jgi:glycosyltransferase involved in cell wall biosynthesis